MPCSAKTCQPEPTSKISCVTTSIWRAAASWPRADTVCVSSWLRESCARRLAGANGRTRTSIGPCQSLTACATRAMCERSPVGTNSYSAARHRWPTCGWHCARQRETAVSNRRLKLEPVGEVCGPARGDGPIGYIGAARLAGQAEHRRRRVRFAGARRRGDALRRCPAPREPAARRPSTPGASSPTSYARHCLRLSGHLWSLPPGVRRRCCARASSSGSTGRAQVTRRRGRCPSARRGGYPPSCIRSSAARTRARGDGASRPCPGPLVPIPIAAAPPYGPRRWAPLANDQRRVAPWP